MNLNAAMESVIRYAIAESLPEAAVRKALTDLPREKGRLVVIAVGKAAWRMANAAHEMLGARADEGVVITKYDHALGKIGRLRIFEAGHPVPDERSFQATRAAMDAVRGLGECDQVLFLLSGGGSALFESPLIEPDELAFITRQLLARGAEISEINSIRKRLSAVKGGRFAQLCAPARVFTIALSDVLGDAADVIASGPSCPDASTCDQARAAAEKYSLEMSERAQECLNVETPKMLSNSTVCVTGSVRGLCAAAEKACGELGFCPEVLTTSLNCEAREAGAFLAAIAREHAGRGERRAFILGGETVVHLTGNGKGGRNQEIALSAARSMEGLNGALLFSIGSDGTDGPTDAAGGWCDGETIRKMREKGVCAEAALRNNDAYRALDAIGNLIKTGATGTNVNDLTVLLVE